MQTCKMHADLLMNANTLILMTLRGNHDIGFVQNENGYFLYIEYTKFSTPIQHFARRADDNVVIKFSISCN